MGMRKRMRSGVLTGWLLAAVLGGGWTAQAQVATTTVQDTVTDASGAAAAGTIVIGWDAFTTAAGVSVAAGSLTTTLGAGGALNVALQPNAGATPMGSYYTAVYHLSDGTASREFWVVPVTVPGGGAAKLAGLRNQVLPVSVAMQTVSKQYVDTKIAKAIASAGGGGSASYLATAGGTLSGPLTLPGDPTLALQAADKHYVDAGIAAVAAAGSASGDLRGAFPSPTVAAVHATSGTLDGVTVGGTTPAAITGTTGVFTSAYGGTALLRIGSNSSNNSGLAAMLVNQPFTLPSGGSHGYSESSALTGVSGSGGYGAFDCVITASGTLDHVNCFQGRQHILTSTTLSAFSKAFSTQITIDGGGSVAALYHYFADEYAGTGTVGTEYGYYCGSWTSKAANNYCIYESGSMPNHFTGAIETLGNMSILSGAHLRVYSPSSTYSNDIYTDSNAKLHVAGYNGGGLFFETGSLFSFCSVGASSCAATISTAGLYHEALTTPASSSAACSAGDFTDDANYHYVCTAANTWKRAALSSF